MENSRPVYVVTSWDDAVADRFTAKLINVLSRYPLKATFFVFLRNGKVSEEEILNLSKIYEIGSHGITHRDMTELSPNLIRKEVSESKHILEMVIGKSVSCFCYPQGSFNNIVKKEVKAAGYIAARTTEPYQIDHGIDPFEVSTTIQARHQTKISLEILDLAKLSVKFLSILMMGQQWNQLGVKLFDMCLNRGGVFHIWGHAWEIERERNWTNLENLFSYISYRKNVYYMSLGEYAQKIYYKKTST